MEHSQGSGHVIGNRSGDTPDYDEHEAHERLHRQLLDRHEQIAADRDGREVRIELSVPLSVVVDLLAGEILRVVVEDEALNVDDVQGAWLAGSGTQLRPDDARARAAHELVRGDLEWPAWEFGW